MSTKRHRRKPLAERARDEREVDRTERILRRADLEHAEVDQLPPERAGRLLGHEAALARAPSEQLADALGEHALFVCQLELHVSPGGARGSGRR